MKKLLSLRNIIPAASVLLQLSTLCFHARGAAGDVDLSFDAGSGINGPVNAVAVLPDGKIIIGGQFTTVKGLARRGVARLHADGSGDGSFDAGSVISSGAHFTHVYAVAPLPDGKVLVGQDLGITRLNADGSRDSSFQLFAVGGDYTWTTALAVQPDGKVLVGGYTVTRTTDPEGYAEYFYNYFLTRVNANGSHDNGFSDTNWGSSSWEYSWINSIVVQSDGRILYGGTFGIVRLHANGSEDSSFDRGGTYGVGAVAVQSDGRVLIGGRFYKVKGTDRNAIARLNADGSLDSSFDPGTGVEAVSPVSPLVESVVLQSDGKVLIGGSFSAYNGTSRSGIARLNADGSVDLRFNPGTGAFGGDSRVYPVALQNDGNVLIGGDFTMVDRVVRSNVARLYGDSLPPLSFAGWAAGFGLSGPAAGSDADPDHDGLPNGVEFVLGDNPRLADASALPTVTLNGGNMLFTFPRDDASESPDVVLTVESGTDLVTWPAVFIIGPTTATSSPGVSIAENGPAPDAITVTIPVGTDQRKFARLKVAIAP